MSQLSLDCAAGRWEIQLPAKERRWITFVVVVVAGAFCGLALIDAALDAPIVLLTFFLAVVSGVSGLWSP